MKLKQLLISTASIAALAVVPISIVSCGNNNNNAVEGLPPAGDNKPGGSTGGSDNDGSNNGGNNSNPGGSTGGSDNDGNNNNQPGGSTGGSTGGSNNGGNDNNQPGWDVDTSSKYINVNSRDGMAAYILANSNIASDFIKKALNRPSYNKVLFSHQWTGNLTSLVYDNDMKITKDNNYTYYNVKSIKFTYAGGIVLNYQFYENGQLVKGYTSTQNGGVITLSVDLQFRSKKDFIGGLGS